MQAVYAYRRCSRDEEAVQGLGLDAQADAIRSYLTSKHLQLTRLFSDPGESGGVPLASRTEGKELVESVQAGDCMVIISRLDRAFRSTVDALTTIHEWHGRGVRLISLAENIDPATPTGKLTIGLFALLAEFERDMISDRTRMAMAVKKGRGERVSHAAAYGWKFVPSGRVNSQGEPVMVLEKDDGEQQVIKLSRAMRRRGWTHKKIAAALDARGIKPRKGGSWRPAAVRAMIQVKKPYRGTEFYRPLKCSSSDSSAEELTFPNLGEVNGSAPNQAGEK